MEPLAARGDTLSLRTQFPWEQGLPLPTAFGLRCQLVASAAQAGHSRGSLEATPARGKMLGFHFLKSYKRTDLPDAGGSS